ncbi:MAG: hypothetical protein OXE44_09370 [Nitrospinae bacterium]|nr:hypothetical protein [Nitrospinota bacterium]
MMKPLPYAEAIAKLAEEERGDGWLAFCERENIFQLSVVEWLDALREEILALAPDTLLEVGAGNGTIGKALQARGVNLILTDPVGRDGVVALDARDALLAHAPDFVFSCWLPFDSGAEKQILDTKNLRWYLAVVQQGPGYAGSEVLWDTPSWSVRELSEMNRWSVSRADFLSEVDSGEHVRHGMAYLFTRED